METSSLLASSFIKTEAPSPLAVSFVQNVFASTPSAELDRPQGMSAYASYLQKGYHKQGSFNPTLEPPKPMLTLHVFTFDQDLFLLTHQQPEHSFEEVVSLFNKKFRTKLGSQILFNRQQRILLRIAWEKGMSMTRSSSEEVESQEDSEQDIEDAQSAKRTAIEA